MAGATETDNNGLTGADVTVDLTHDADIMVDLTHRSIDLHQIEMARITAASSIASNIVSYFGKILICLFLGGLLVLGGGLVADMNSPSAPSAVNKASGNYKSLPATSELAEHYAHIVTSVAGAVTTLFGPILGFVLGHYFVRKEN